MADIFLSYSREDQPTARRFAEGFEREGFTVWWDQALDAGESFDKVTEQALKDAKAVVVLWSKKAVDSRWVRAEATQADRFGTLVPVMIEPCVRPIMFELTHTADLSGWSGDVGAAPWRSFIEGLRRTTGRASSTATVSAAPAPSDAVAARAIPGKAAWIGIAAAALLAGGLFWHFQRSEDQGSTLATSAPAATTPATPASVAVLPFRDMSQNKDQEYFADGVTEEILNTLAGIKDLKVTARTSAFAFKGKDVDLRTVGETLGVRHILEGSIRKDGETLRITAQLIDAKTDSHIWSRTYDRPLQDIFSVQEDIARSVAEALQVTLGVGFGGRPGMTRNVEAYDTVLEVDPLIRKQTVESQRRAIGLLEKAVTLDPAYGDAWTFLAGTYVGMAGLAKQDAPLWQQKADAALEKARQLTPDSPIVRYVLAEQSISRKNWIEAAGHFNDLEIQRAQSGLPASSGNGRFLLMVGRAREAVASLEEEKARDPLNPETSFFLGVAYSAVRDFPAAMAEIERGQALDASWQDIFQVAAVSIALAMQDPTDIKRRLEGMLANTPVAQREFLTRLTGLLDRPSDAQEYLRAQARDPSTTAATLRILTQYLAYIGDPKSALESHRLAFERGGVNPAIFITWYPVMREARRLPEFRQLVRELGLLDYWREHGWGDFCKPTGETDFECT
jgi:TolB-like protein/tetratricopeptide (TPR) repeat protein